MFPVFIFAIVIVAFGSLAAGLRALIKSQAGKEAAFVKWVQDSGYKYDGPEPRDNRLSISEISAATNRKPVTSPPGLELSTYNKGQLWSAVYGHLSEAGNEFSVAYQIERNRGPNSQDTLHRTVATVAIPDTRLQLIINSKLNNDEHSGGNLGQYKKAQQQQLEGNFSDFFEVYLPSKTQSEALSLLAPNTMQLIMAEFADFDIEVNGKFLFIYAYRHIYDPRELEQMLAKIDRLLSELRLQSSNVRASQAATARSTTSPSADHRSLSKLSTPAIVLRSLLLVAVPLTAIFVYLSISKSYELAFMAIIAIPLAVTFVWTGWRSVRQNKLKKRHNATVRQNFSGDK